MSDTKNFLGGRGRLPAHLHDVVIGLCIVCTVATLAQWSRRWEVVRNLDWELFNRLSKARDFSKSVDRIAVVEIDTETYAHFEHTAPLPRDYLARLIATICERSHPRAIGLDVLLDSSMPPERRQEDMALENALQIAKAHGVPVVLAADPAPPQDDGPYLPLQRFRGYSRIGHVDVRKESDGEVRSVDWLIECGGKVYPSLALALAACAHKIREEDTVRWGQTLLRPRGRYAGYIVYPTGAPLLRIPGEQITDASPFLSELNDRIVIIGATAEATGDFHQTPFAEEQYRNGILPGCHIQAYAVSTLLASGLPTPVALTDWLVSALCSGIFLIMLYRLSTLRAILMSGALFIVCAFGALWRFVSSGYLLSSYLFNIVPVLLAALCCALAWWVLRALYLRSCFSAFVSKPVLRSIGSVNDLRDLRPVTGVATVMFCDLIGYSRACRRLSPEQALTMTNYYLAPIPALVEAHDGLLERYTGDGCLAYFGAPLPGQKSPRPEISVLAAVQVAWKLQEMMSRLRAEASVRGIPQLQMSVGIHTGPLSAGLIGASQHIQFTIMGDTVNLASRVESVGHRPEVQPPLQTRIMLSEEAVRLLGVQAVVEDKSYETSEKVNVHVFELLEIRSLEI